MILGGNMKELSPTQLKAIDEWLANYKEIEKKIKVRKLELETIANDDINKSVSNKGRVSKHTETVVCRWDNDLIINSLTTIKTTIDTTLDKLDNEQSDIFYYRWVNGLTWEEIADKLQIKTKNIYRKRKFLIENIAYNMGLNY